MVEISDGRPACSICGWRVITEDDRPAAVFASQVISDESDLDLDDWREADSCVCKCCMDSASDDEDFALAVRRVRGRALYSAMSVEWFQAWELAREEAALTRWKERVAK